MSPGKGRFTPAKVTQHFRVGLCCESTSCASFSHQVVGEVRNSVPAPFTLILNAPGLLGGITGTPEKTRPGNSPQAVPIEGLLPAVRADAGRSDLTTER